jgi:multicomponent Na+:H+ antiporter subunit D
VIVVPPGLILMVGGLLLALLPRKSTAQAVCALLLPILSFAQFWMLPEGDLANFTMFGVEFIPVRVDALARVFGTIFHIAAFTAALYALHVRDGMQHVSGMVYAGSAIAAVFAGDLVTLFVWWEITAISSVFLIWASRTEEAWKCGIRYLVIQVGSGVLLLAGMMARYADTGSVAFDHIGLGGAGGALILLAFGIKAAFPLLHNWLQDAYPKATVTGTVFLSAFTTKLAIYALARGYAGTSILITIGVVMTLFPIIFAVIENDLRKVLAYSLNNQLGFMVVGVGIGTELAINGTVAHAFCHILYKALLFMGVGAVLHRTGTSKASELGGLYKSMPFTTVFTIIGAMSISAFPLFSGFVSKSLIQSAAIEGHMTWVWVGLLFASAGVMEHSGIKIPFFAFFAHDGGHRVKEAPLNMLLAMGIAAAFCVGVGVYPEPLYAFLPYPVEYVPYTVDHVVTQLQLLLFAALAFGVLIRKGWYPAEIKALNLDFDWVYRRWLPGIVHDFRSVGAPAWALFTGTALALLKGTLQLFIVKPHGPRGALSRTWPAGSTAMWAAFILGAYLLLYLF